MKSFREAVLNALAHRDRTRQEEIVVVGYVDAWGMSVREGIFTLLPKVNGADLDLGATEDYLNVTRRKRRAGDE